MSTSSAFAVQSGSGSPNVTVTSGQSASVPLSVTGAATYTGKRHLDVHGIPGQASCAFNPATPNLAGGTPQSSTLTVSTTAGDLAGMVKLFLDPA